jgi:hypothetical protein
MQKIQPLDIHDTGHIILLIEVKLPRNYDVMPIISVTLCYRECSRRNQ